MHSVTAAPWDIGRPQPAFAELATKGQISGRVLDVGCGTGEHVLMAAALGLDATGIDLDDRALEVARAGAVARGLAARFARHDAFEVEALGEHFDTVLDCGLLHAFAPTTQAELVLRLGAVVAPGGRLFVLGGWGPHRLAEDEIRAALDGWTVTAAPTTIATALDTGDLPAALLEAARP
jgi:SAM-dependent methyltransferase